MSDTEAEMMKARFVGVNHDTDILKRQIPVEIGEGSELVLQFGDSDMLDAFLEIADDKPEFVKEFQSFSEKIKILDDEELNNCLKCCSDDMISLLSTTVSCVGCRRAVETLFQLVSEMDYHTLCPIKLLKCVKHQTSCEFTLEYEYLMSLKSLFMILYVFKPQLELVVNIIPKSRKSKRCNLHCLDSHKVKSIGVWMDFWKSLNISSRDEIVTINIDAFVEALDSYLQKHRFCQECKAKVERAYKLLLKEASPENEEDYDGEIFSGIKVCKSDGHLHIDSADDIISGLISRAEPELTNSRRERHAKTMDVAQEEVLTCLGIVLHEKLHKLCQKVKAEEQTWMILVNTCLECLKRRLVLAIEEKRGYTNMDLFLLEHEQETKKKEMKKEIKREKKRKKKLARKTTSEGASDSCSHSPTKDDFGFDEDDEEEEERDEREEDDELAKKLAATSPMLNNIVCNLVSPLQNPQSQHQQQCSSEDAVDSSDEKSTDWQVVENNHCKQCNSRKSSRSQRIFNGKSIESPNSPNSIHYRTDSNRSSRCGNANPILSSRRKPKSNTDTSACTSPGNCCRSVGADRHPLKCTEKNSNSQTQRSNRSLNKVAVSVNNNGKRQHCSLFTPTSVSSSSLPSSNQFKISAPCQCSCSSENASSESCCQLRPPNGRQNGQVLCCKNCELASSISGNSRSGKSKNESEDFKATENKRIHRVESSGSHKTLARAFVSDPWLPEYLSVSTSEEVEVGEDFITEQERLYFQDNWAEIREQRDLLRSKLRQAWSDKTKAIS